MKLQIKPKSIALGHLRFGEVFYRKHSNLFYMLLQISTKEPETMGVAELVTGKVEYFNKDIEVILQPTATLHIQPEFE